MFIFFIIIFYYKTTFSNGAPFLFFLKDFDTYLNIDLPAKQLKTTQS